MLRKLAILLCLLPLTFLPSSAGEDSIRVSLLTCSAGQEVYELYGHTAIRCQLPGDGLDVVFNYGVFDFRQKHFAWHFALGQCDYMVEPLPWPLFIEEYEARGSSITAQELNLTPEEAGRLFDRLVWNSRPENRQYRYNFLYNNCTTMVRDQVEHILDGRILYPDTLPHLTYRQMLHQYTARHPWTQEGNDLLLGADVDTLLSNRAMMFAPECFMHFCSGAVICDKDGNRRPLVRRTEVPVKARPQAVTPEFPLSPGQAMCVFAAVCLLIMALEMRTRRLFWLWDVLLLVLQGLAGTLLAFMSLFSAHPAVGSNWLLWLLNPCAFVGVILVTRAALRHQTTRWYAFHFTVLALFLLFSPWIPQVFGKIILPLALCLLTRPVSYLILCLRKQTPCA